MSTFAWRWVLPIAAGLAVIPVGGPVSPAAEPIPDLPFFYDLYTFRNDAGGTTVVAAVAVQARRLQAERENRETRYRFDLRFVVADTASREVFPSVDSVFATAPRRLPGQHLLHTFVEVDAPPSASTLQRVVVTDAQKAGVGQLYTTPFPIPDYSGDELMLSDIALGLPGRAGGWERRGVSLALLPTSQFPESTFDLYYEVYNLPSGRSYRTEIAIERLDDGGSEPVRTRFTEEAASDARGTLAELRHVQSALPQGRHRLTVTVTDAETGRSASASRELHVRGWRGGTTLVPALPRGRPTSEAPRPDR